MKNSNNKLVSIIIRTKDEEKWISQCLRAVFNQNYKNIEVIIVDNNSTDLTIARAKEFSVKVINIKSFFPGKAINEGVRVSRGEIIVCLSAHGIPTNNTWLENLIHELSDSSVAGIYGRQEPLSFSSDIDKRDLLTVFGLDKKIQKKDPFFHNANSAFTKKVWNKFSFDEDVTNIEDRIWGKKVIADGLKIIYEPEASIYHWHGIHQNLNPERASSVVKILESEGFLPDKKYKDVSAMNIVSIIPIKGELLSFDSKYPLDYTIQSIKKSQLVKKIIVSTDNDKTASKAKDFGADNIIIRPKRLSEDYVDIIEVLKFTLEKIEDTKIFPDIVVISEETYPFRPFNLIDNMIQRFLSEGMDTLIAGRQEPRITWKTAGDKTELINEDAFIPRKFKKNKTILSLLGLASITYPKSIRNNDIRSGKIGIYEIDEPLSSIEIRNNTTLEIFSRFIHSWTEGQKSKNDKS